jgi:methylated-DNA-[protein]-cysteine S-methyltransferase
MKKAYIYETKLGRIFIAEDGQGITELSLLPEGANTGDLPDYEIIETDRMKEAINQLKEYLEGSRKEFTIELRPEGTIFQKKVWEALRAIPYGETRTYKQIAAQIGNEKACRAVGMANHNNPILCMIPCHRVIGADGSLVGYACGLSVKEQLLRLEKERIPVI